MNCDQDTVFDIKALTAEEREIIRALRDPATARELYDLMHISNILSTAHILEL